MRPQHLLRAAVALCAFIASPSQPARAEPEQALRPADFAYSRALALPDDKNPIASIELPADVYRASRSKSLADVVVFNAAGARVPQALQRPAAEPNKAAASAVAFFPIALEQASAPLELALRITRGADGEVLALRSPTAAEAQGAQNPRPVGAYVLDLRKLSEAATPEHQSLQLTAARFEWLEPPRDLILPLVVERSDDLIHWETVPVDGGILHLEHEGQRIDRDRIEWSAISADFMRVRAVGQRGLPAQLQAVYVEAAAGPIAPQLERVVVTGTRSSEQQVFRFDLGGPVPAEELELELPEDNTVIAGELSSADSAAGPYRELARASFYRVSAHDKSLQGPRVQIPPQRARYYELRIDASRGAIDNGVPNLVTLHVPERLLFVRRGEAPYTLAYGRHNVQLQRFEPSELLRLLPSLDGTPLSPVRATVAEPQVAGGLSLLEPPQAPPPYKTYVLWAALLAGVALLAWLSLRLLKGNA